jgi:nucleotide-binding universal stress UspA family protein
MKTMHKKILHGLDGSSGSLKALEEAISLAKTNGAELHCISIEEVPRYAETVGEAIEEKAVAAGKYTQAIAQAQEMAGSHSLTITTHVFVGHEVKTIIEFIKQNGFDLLVIGFMGHSAVYDRIMGSTCQSLVRLAPCSVVVVK